jgi:hypothetical protein
MSEDETAPSIDSALERIIDKALPKLEDLVENGGVTTTPFTCNGCGRQHQVTHRVSNTKDLGALVGTLTTARAKLKEKEDPTSAKAIKYQVDLGELSSAALAERIVLLEEQLAVSVEEGI